MYVTIVSLYWEKTQENCGGVDSCNGGNGDGFGGHGGGSGDGGVFVVVLVLSYLADSDSHK
jgi:hypothetical protein